MFELTEQKQQLLLSKGNLLILGGPGSGKTTIALLKARYELSKKILKAKQKILFLSFARATISRIEQQLSDLKITKEIKEDLEINTYHGFTWEILKSHGYLLCNFRQIRLLPPPQAAARLAEFTESSSRDSEKRRLFFEEGFLHFDLFAEFCADLLENSESLTKIICDSYPIIILDEFQDTNQSEWRFIKRLGSTSQIIALADVEQRIYEFRGANPARIADYQQNFTPTLFDFGIENNRSDGTDIVKFGNDLLSANIGSNKYNDVRYIFYKNIKKNIHLQMKQEVLAAIQRLNKKDRKWSLAILVPSKTLMLQVSDYLSKKQLFDSGRSLPQIEHEVALEKEALSLTAILIAGLMENKVEDSEINNRLIIDLIEYIRGRKGNIGISPKELELSNSLLNYLETRKIKGKNRINTINECLRISSECRQTEFRGNPTEDWITIRNIISSSTCELLKQVAKDSMYLRLLRRGSVLQSGLSNLWREKSSYSGSINLVRNALLQEHFSKTSIVLSGIQVMTIHKAKGKEFDEVIIYEGPFSGKIVRNTNDQKDIYKSRILLRVAVTRAIRRTTILTPVWDSCILLN